MSRYFISSLQNLEPYIPATLSEIYDLLGSMIRSAPTFIDKLGYFPEQNIDSEFQILVASFGKVRKKLGEERYAALVDLAAGAKALFAADPVKTMARRRRDGPCCLRLRRSSRRPGSAGWKRS
ncbi:hypothetical protein BH10PSE12_BH10PSE12_27420 [soil metagenome]